MRIGVDAGTLRKTLTGVGWYLTQILGEFTRIATEHSFYLYASGPLIVPPSGQNMHLRIGNSHLPGAIWLQTQGRKLAGQDHLDVFWGPAHVLPLGLDDSVRTVLTVHDIVWVLHPESMARYNALVHRLYFRKSVRRADAIAVVSEETGRDLGNKLKVEESRITVTHEGVEDTFRPLSAELTEGKLQAIGISGSYVLSVGTLEPRKNYPLLLRALARLETDLNLVVAGRKGWKYNVIFEQVKRLNLQDRVRFMEYVPTEDLVALYCGAEFLVMPSLYEGFGLPVLQAMACGTPVLASNCSSLPEVGGDAAAYFDPASVESLIAEMSELVENETLRSQMRKKGLLRARLFTWRRTAEELLYLFHSDPSLSGLPSTLDSS